MANSLGWADTAVAATYSLTLLFLRTPLLSAVGALPTLLSAQVAFNKLRQFSPRPVPGRLSPRRRRIPDWQTLELRDVTFHYPDQRFAVGPLNPTLKRGELVFLIGGNGSGKSTLAMLLTGLYQPISGQILVDGQPLAAERPEEYRKLFSAVFTDVWLFDRLLGPQGEEADPGAGGDMAGASANGPQAAAGERKDRRPAAVERAEEARGAPAGAGRDPGTSFCWMNGRRIRIRISAASSTRSCCR